MPTKMRTPAYTILENLIADTGAAIGLIYGYSSDRSRMRLVSSIGSQYDFPAWDPITDCWAERLDAHEHNAPYELFVSNLKEGGACRQRYLDIGCDYSLSYPIILHGRLCGFVAALWRSIPTLSSSHRNFVTRAALDLAEIVDDAGYPKAATDEELRSTLKTVAGEYGSMCKLLIGIDLKQKILYWKDQEDFLGFGDEPPIGMDLSTIFLDPSFGAVHQKLIEGFIDGAVNYRPMNVSRQIEIKDATGKKLAMVVALLRRVSVHNTYGALAMGFPVRETIGGALVPDQPGAIGPIDPREARAYRALGKVADTTRSVDLRGAIGLAILGIVIGFFVLAWFGKLPMPQQLKVERSGK